MNNSGKRIIITGSSKGIGRETAAFFADKGANVVINGRDESALHETQDKLLKHGLQVEAVAGDVSDPESARRVVADAASRLGGLDVLINNAGIATRGRFEDTRPEVWERVISTNLFGAVYMTQAALPYIRASKGSILFVSSLVALWGFPLVSSYSASKMALNGIIESLRSELNGTEVHIGVVYVGFAQNDEQKRILAADGSSTGLAPRASAMSQERVAESIYRSVEIRRNTRVLTVQGKLLSLTVRLMPWLMRFGVRLSSRRINEYAE